jgi:inner membrane protein
MDPLTHALTGALLASAAKKRADARRSVLPDEPPTPQGSSEAPANRASSGIATWKVVLVLAVAAMSPDVDILLEQISNIATLTDRRGITHSVIGIPLMAILVGGVFTLAFRDRKNWARYLLIAGAGIALHIVFDLINAFGVMLLAPFSWQRFDFGITFIIYLWLGGLLLAGVMASLMWRRSRVPAIAAWCAIAIYFGAMIAGKWMAQDFAKTSLPTAFEIQSIQPDQLNKEVAVAFDVFPRPLSPFHWTVVMKRGDDYRVAHVNVVRSTPAVAAADAGLFARIRAAFVPKAQAQWSSFTEYGSADVAFAQRAFAHSDMAFFRAFAKMPAFMKQEEGALGRCAFFQDLQFLSPGREAHPFRYGVCFSGTEGKDAKVYRYADDGNHEFVPHPRRLLF